MADSLRLGYSDQEMAESPYAQFFRPEVAPLTDVAREAIQMGAQASELFEGLEDAAELVAQRHARIETGFAHCPDGETRVFDLTHMPGVAPAMWDWWFGWHGDEALKYKLWHPRAHVHVAWADGKGDTGAYVGRTSHVVEYIGSTRLKGSIRFVPPSEVGIDEEGLAKRGEVCICGRIGPVSPGIDAGWLLHHVYPVEGGSEMRSYFWLGGRHIAARSGNAFATSLVRGAAKLFPKATEVPATDLLVHCAQEMGHLATILPDVYEAFGRRNAPSEPKEAAQ